MSCQHVRAHQPRQQPCCAPKLVPNCTAQTLPLCCSKSSEPPALQSTLGIERAESFCSGVGAPAPPRSATDPSNGASRPHRRPQIEFTSLAQFSSRVELYRGRYDVLHCYSCRRNATLRCVHGRAEGCGNRCEVRCGSLYIIRRREVW